jgi:hypothetical protein
MRQCYRTHYDIVRKEYEIVGRRIMLMRRELDELEERLRTTWELRYCNGYKKKADQTMIFPREFVTTHPYCPGPQQLSVLIRSNWLVTTHYSPITQAPPSVRVACR